MEMVKSTIQSKSIYKYILVAGIVLVAMNLRPAITSIGPLVGMIQKDLGLVHWSVGFLTSLPLIAFAFVSPMVPKLAKLLSNERSLIIGLLTLLIGIIIRFVPHTVFLFTGTLFVGIGIAICNVLLPVIVKEKFPRKFGLLTSVYSTSLTLMASVASGVSVPLASGLSLGWKNSLMIWGVPVVIAILIWIFLDKRNLGHEERIKPTRSKGNEIWRSALAWQIAFFFGFQSFMFYVTIAWLPEIMINRGVSLEMSGWLLSVTQLIGLPFSFIVPMIAGRFRSQQWLGVGLSICSVIGFAGLLWNGSYTMMLLSSMSLGIGLGGCFPLGLTFIGLRARDGRQASELSGMAQSVGYILAAIGPLFIGYLYDLTHHWTVPLITMVVISLLLVIFSVFAGREKYVY
ncbi:MFS transporter [Bacillus sp. DNRA2]|uniref:CynX/NimT family MFS transporter n=1 Tax=Bacillus sp. DNRA2 TaxID=2723053 RepID=UPI00145F3125|nr:MFS transporter [Bacillus sp. DNRA2]NMD71731.1 MFS transporter [Bacillus sp. DNRA2]